MQHDIYHLKTFFFFSAAFFFMLFLAFELILQDPRRIQMSPLKCSRKSGKLLITFIFMELILGSLPDDLEVLSQGKKG